MNCSVQHRHERRQRHDLFIDSFKYRKTKVQNEDLGLLVHVIPSSTETKEDSVTEQRRRYKKTKVITRNLRTAVSSLNVENSEKALETIQKTKVQSVCEMDKVSTFSVGSCRWIRTRARTRRPKTVSRPLHRLIQVQKDEGTK